MTIPRIIANAIAFNPRRWGTSMISTETIDNLFTLLKSRQIPYLLVGGVAMLAYVEGRNTEDIDLLIAPDDLIRLPELVVSSQDQNFARALFDGVQVDLLLTSNRLFQMVIDRHSGRLDMGQIIQCATPLGLMLLKLFALPSLYRQGRFQRANLYEGDITALMLRFPAMPLERLPTLLQPYILESDRVELTQICQEIRQRLNRMQR